MLEKLFKCKVVGKFSIKDLELYIWFLERNLKYGNTNTYNTKNTL